MLIHFPQVLYKKFNNLPYVFQIHVPNCNLYCSKHIANLSAVLNLIVVSIYSLYYHFCHLSTFNMRPLISISYLVKRISFFFLHKTISYRSNSLSKNSHIICFALISSKNSYPPKRYTSYPFNRNALSSFTISAYSDGLAFPSKE